MAYITLYDDIIFVEGELTQATKKKEIKTRIGGIGAHFRTLNNIKEKMAIKAKESGYNCIVNFIYGQKTKFLSFDNINYVGSGWGSLLDSEDYKTIKSQLKGNTQ